MLEADKVFVGSIPENYDRYMVPLIFEPYAADIARRAASSSPSAVLETAAGSGVVTCALARQDCLWDRIIIARRNHRVRNHPPSGPPSHSHG